jgi:hypothetical protein
MKKVLFIMMTVVCGCTVPKSDFQRIMKQEGIENPIDKGYAIFGCGNGDNIKTEFSGIKNGVRVDGIICGGFIKGYTIRYK